MPPGNQTVPSIPLRDAKRRQGRRTQYREPGQDATASVSTLFRAEIALAKAELVDAGKAGRRHRPVRRRRCVMALYTSLFFFFFLAVLLDIWLSPWLAWLIVFLILLTITIVSASSGTSSSVRSADRRRRSNRSGGAGGAARAPSLARTTFRRSAPERLSADTGAHDPRR